MIDRLIKWWTKPDDLTAHERKLIKMGCGSRAIAIIVERLGETRTIIVLEKRLGMSYATAKMMVENRATRHVVDRLADLEEDA